MKTILNIKNIQVLAFLLGIAGTMLSCKKSFLDLTPISQIGATNFYKTQSDLLNAVNGAYGALQLNGQYTEEYYFLADYPDDDIESSLSAANNDFDQFERFYSNSANIYIAPAWTDGYKGILRCNNIITQAPNVTMDASLKGRYVAEAKYLRALMYFNLVRIFGDVPLVIAPLTTVSDAYEVGRSPVADVYVQIVKDLTDAEAAVPLSYTGADIGRVTKGAVQTLLGQVYLTQKNYTGAVTELAQVVNSNVYKLLPVYSDVFNPANGNNAEVIFSVGYKKGGIGEGSPFVNAFLPTGGIPTLVTIGTTGNRMNGSKDLYFAFEPGDTRRAISIDTSFIDGTGKLVKTVFTRKYLDTPPTDKDGDNDWFVHRYSDALLMYAEALNETNQTPIAHTYLNLVRNRAGLASKTGLDQAGMRLALEQERRVELCFEGHRWFDLIRTGRAITVMNAYFKKYNILLGGVLVQIAPYQLIQPVPLSQIQANPAKMPQNPGYGQ
ncbi:putative outer membrane starch-binding protein [Mucilaginibacter gracilis]|uniref:Putative outer membrane starch-binding protein n=1 Tax=Mucilaginibacter gracilis TaxID=423350 RepID=A0A495IT51_9SPHI|nr:RagB/SusD family nutrient uptake outer membrane protein [Mucilaginibacter gracilis]RKR79955.1 putative outer membrane starch-binding protein [Mucilaginibacter gracilis]